MQNIQLNGEDFAVHGEEVEALADWMRTHDGGNLAAQLQLSADPPAPASLAAALALVQAEIPEVVKSEAVKNKDGSPRYTYADLSAVTRAILPMLGRVGLSWITRPTLLDGSFVLVYRLQHASGDFIEGVYPLPTSADPQATGSAITYARRYCLCSVTGVAPGDDDDAAEATAAYRRGDQAPPAAPGGMSQFERDAGMAFLARPSDEKRAATPTAILHAALQQALDFGRCLDEHRAWTEAVGETTWGAALAARVIDEIEHANTQDDVNTLWGMLKAASYNPEIEGKNMVSRIKERAAAIVARNAALLNELAERAALAEEIGELEGPITAAIIEARAGSRITETEERNLVRMVHDRVIKLGRLDNRAAPVDGEAPWSADGE